MILDSKFSPSWWLSNPHLQTLWASKFRRPQPPSTFPERLELADGDFVDINWSDKRLAEPNLAPTASFASETNTHFPNDIQNIVCIFHGLAGSIQSSYARGIINALNKDGYASVLMHFRGCSNEPNRLPSSYHSGHTVDIAYLIELLRQRLPGTRIHAVGYSLGANALLKYLGEQGEKCPLSSAVAVSPPLVLHEGADRLMRGFSRIYQRHLISIMKEQLDSKRRRYPDLKLPEKTDNLNTFWEFDNEVTAPLSGFKDVHEYYRLCSARHYLSRIAIPAHIISARDDPFFSERIFPGEDELSSSVKLELSQHGGHVGFISGSNPRKPVYWLEPRILELLQAYTE